MFWLPNQLGERAILPLGEGRAWLGEACAARLAAAGHDPSGENIAHGHCAAGTMRFHGKRPANIAV